MSNITVQTCIICPKECSIEVSSIETLVTYVSGYNCDRGRAFAIQETLSPSRTLTTTVPVKNGGCTRLPVRSSKPVPKGLIRDWMAQVKQLAPEAPVVAGEVLIANIFGSGSDVISSKSVGRKQ
ncbi:DUF1667 domain-containing protein [Paenibacillus sp. HN-1]|uniref:DUF1667 domain-containing protein n=1 Tax=Paenibacillus TaxID=44249 RepID=UPI001CA93D6D|nr:MULTISPECIES: DUF1667 domain-containing protein [Paenibacillus]MBY9081480.1 DUF1667 domain-containing protein [Paenibacillus sp. CGMCC 1.18879]MBY9085000.1 DUF1667 domain-containing protein [Paenibacillus sinensis]